jgi:hypothetical protein
MPSRSSLRRLAAPLAALGIAAGDPAPAEGARAKSPLHVSTGAGVFLPWDGDTGFDVIALVHKGLGSDRFWLGGELEYRRYEAELKRGYDPVYDTFAVRFSFQYHPFPEAPVSPYAGIGVGLQLSRVDETHSRGERVRHAVSGGTTLLGLAGVDLGAGLLGPLTLFAEARVGNTADVWDRKGGNLQLDQIDGFTGMGGLRLRF